MLAHFGHHLPGSLLPPLSTFISDEYSLNKTQLGLLGSAYNLPYGLSQLPAGWLADRIGPRILTLIGVSGVAVCGLLVGLSPTYIVMVVFLVLLGIMGGGYHPAASPLVSSSVNEKNRGRALGFHQIGGAASFVLTPLIAAAIAGAIGWRGAFISLSIPTFIFGIVLYMLLKRWGDTRKTVQETAGSYTGTPPPQDHLRHLVAFIFLGVVLQVLIYSTFLFIPRFAVEEFGVTEETAAALLSLAHLAGLWSGPLGGYLSDRLGKVPVLVVASFVAAPFFYLLSQAWVGWSISLVLLVMGTCQYIGMPVAEAYIISHARERHRSTILGIYYFASRGGPGIIMPVMGYLIDQMGFGSTFTIVGAAVLVVTLGCSAFLWRSRG